MGNEPSSITADDLQVELEQQLDQLGHYLAHCLYHLRVEAEKKAGELFKQETSFYISYQEITKKGYSGFMQAYLQATVDKNTMTTRAKRDVALSLAKYDLLWDLTFVSFFLFYLNA